MDYLLAVVSEYFGDGSVILVLLIAAAVFIFMMALSTFLLSSTRRAKRRLKALNDDQFVSELGYSSEALYQHPDDESTDTFDKFFTPQNDTERKERRDQPIQAGFYAQTALINFYFLKVALAIGLPIVALIFSHFDPTVSIKDALLYITALFSLGIFLPDFVLRKLVARRQAHLRKSFPDALDLLVVCVEAGMGLDAAFLKVSKSLAVGAPELADELEIVNASIRVGMSRSQALNDMLKRTGLTELKGLIAILDQSARYGSSVADSLRVFAEEFRDKRVQAAEEEAAKVGTKLLMPMILFLWPAFFIVAVGPAVLMLIEGFSKMTL